MKEQFKEINFRKASLDIIDVANDVIESYTRQGHVVTLRQLYYRFIALDLFPDSWMDVRLKTKNTRKNYKRFGTLINDGRLAGLIDWDSIEDRTRNLQSLIRWDSPEQIIRASWKSYNIDMWDNQQVRCEVWVEKEALAGVIASVCGPLDVPYFSCRGYVSQSEMYVAAKRILGYLDAGQAFTIFHLGDHDPSGIDMTSDNRDRLWMFLESEGVEVDRLALNWEQIEMYNPPPNFAKVKDSRFSAYAAEFGDESWELDALEPSVLADLVRYNILNIRDDDAWGDSMQRLTKEREGLRSIYMNYDAVVAMIGRLKD